MHSYVVIIYVIMYVIMTIIMHVVRANYRAFHAAYETVMLCNYYHNFITLCYLLCSLATVRSFSVKLHYGLQTRHLLFEIDQTIGVVYLYNWNLSF